MTSCGPTPTSTPEPVTVSISGSAAMVPLLAKLGKEFESAHRSVTVIVYGGNSFLGAALALDGTVDLGAVSVFPSDRVWSAPIATDGLAIVVHPDNSLENLTLGQLHDLFAGLVWRWSDLGLEPPSAESAWEEIAVVSREEGSGERMAFESLVMAGNRSAAECQTGLGTPSATPGGSAGTAPDARDVLQMDSHCEGDPVTTTAVLATSSADVLEFVSTHPAAIAYLSAGWVSSDVKVVAVEGARPTPAHIAAGKYSLVQPFYLIAPREPTGAPRQFVDFCLSAQGQAIVAKQYLPVRPPQ